jgi:hypothetical protein
VGVTEYLHYSKSSLEMMYSILLNQLESYGILERYQSHEQERTGQGLQSIELFGYRFLTFIDSLLFPVPSDYDRRHLGIRDEIWLRLRFFCQDQHAKNVQQRL